MPKVILCKCYYGGYDLCADCGGSGVIIQHKKNDYKPLKSVTKKLPSSILPPSLTLREKVLHHVKIDESLIAFLKKKFYRLPFEKRLTIIDILNERLAKWKTSAAIITDKLLKDDVQEYIAELSGRIRFFNIVVQENGKKKNNKRKNRANKKK